MASLLVSCKTMQNAVDSKDLSYIYNPTKNPFTPRYNVINESDETSNLSIKFFATDLFFSEANPKGMPISSIQISVRLFNTTEGRALSDTAFINLNIIKEENRNEYQYTIPLPVIFCPAKPQHHTRI
jgi:hypothetical protein